MTEYAAAWIPVSDEAIVDNGLGTAEDQAAAARRIDAARARSEANWRALPFRVRASRTVIGWWWSVKWSVLETIRRRVCEECDD